MSCTCEYGSKRACEFCEHRAQVNARLKKLEDAQASADYARGVAEGERRATARVVASIRAWLRGDGGFVQLSQILDAIERGEHDKEGER